MKTQLTLILTLLISAHSFAQHKQYERKHEIGFGFGGMNYTGDLTENLKLKYTKPGGNLFYRYNFSDEVSVIRVNILVGKLGVDETKSSEPLRAQRGLAFSGLLTEVSALYEYDFFNFRDIKNKYYMSPYLFGGIATSNITGSSTATFIGIPFGTGMKFRVIKGLNFGTEIGARKNFTDSLDGQEDEQLLGTTIQTDWHYYAGINLSYTFYNLVCKEPARH